MKVPEFCRKIWTAAKNDPAFASLLADEEDEPYFRTYFMDRLPIVLEKRLDRQVNIASIVAAQREVMIDMLENGNLIKRIAEVLEDDKADAPTDLPGLGDWASNEEILDVIKKGWQMEIHELPRLAEDLIENLADIVGTNVKPAEALAKILVEDLRLSPENAEAASRGRLTIGELTLSQPSTLFPSSLVS